jgi:hypothetical protein
VSRQQVQEFYRKVATTRTLQARLKGLDALAKTDAQAALDEAVRIATEEGFRFSADDLQEVRRQPERAPNAEPEVRSANCPWEILWEADPPPPPPPACPQHRNHTCEQGGERPYIVRPCDDLANI